MTVTPKYSPKSILADSAYCLMPRTPFVILIEDQTELGRVVKDVLWGEGYEISLVPDPSEALAILRKRTVDLLVSDLPSTGEADNVLAPLIEEFPDLGVIVVRDPADEPAPFFGPWRVSGSCLILRRPFRLADLLAASRELIA